MAGLAFVMALHTSLDGKLHVEVSPPDETEHLTSAKALLILHLWQESPDVIRFSVHHPLSGATAYVQGSSELARLSQAIELQLKS